MRDSVILVTRAGLGNTPDDTSFGVEMIDNFFHTLEKQPEKPSAICLYTEGVKLLSPDSDVVLGLRLLEGLGIRILACGSCLDHYQIGPELPVGQRGTMVEIVQLIGSAKKVITI